MSAAKPTATHREVYPAKGLAALAFQRLGQPLEPGRISSECEILGSDAGSDQWCTKSRVRHQLERVRIGQAGSQPCPSHLQRSSTNGRGLQVAPQVSRGLSLRQDHPHNRLSIRARITPSNSRIFSAMQFSSIHCTRDLAQSSLPAHAPCSAGLWPAGCVSPAGIFFASSMARRLSGVSAAKAAVEGASNTVGGGRRAYQKGFLFGASHASTLALTRPVHQQVRRFLISMEAPMEQTELRLLGRIDGGPAVVPTSYLKAAKTYREAVRLCWKLRRAQNLTKTDLARHFGFIRQHVTDYLEEDDAPGRRNLPAERIADFEIACENSAVSQWLAARSSLTVLEELQASRVAA